MIHPEHKSKPTIKDLFPDAITAQSLEINDENNDELVDPTDARRCLIFISRDENTLTDIHMNNGSEDPEAYANKIIKRLKSFYKDKFKVILIGGDELISQHFVDAVINALENDPQIIFDKEHSDTGGVWVRSVRANANGAIIERKERSWGEPEGMNIPFPNK
jgi:hypothetical protein